MTVHSLDRKKGIISSLNPHFPFSVRMQDPSGDAFEQAQKMLTFYELDLGLNHVVRKSTKPIDNGANLLVAVPGSQDGPGKVDS